MTAATALHWMMENLVSAHRASPILCAAPGFEIGSCQALRPYAPKLQRRKG